MVRKLSIPPNFSVMRCNNTTLFVKEDYKEVVTELFFQTKSFNVHNNNNTHVKFGRGCYATFPITEKSNERMLVRNYRHGGLFGKLIGNIFVNRNRPLKELCVHEIASNKGVPSPSAIGVTIECLWKKFYTACFISKEIPDTLDLIQFFREAPPDFIKVSKKHIISSIARLLRKMHDAGIYHADLHLKNILIKKNPHGGFEAYIIDLDKSVVLNQLSTNQRFANLLRLDRSLEKFIWHSFKPDDQKESLISKTDRIRLFRSYMLCDPVICKDWKTYIRRYHSRYTFHKLWWYVLGSSGK